jgi:hypothetical protein
MGSLSLTTPGQKGLAKNEIIIPSPSYSIRNNCSLGRWMKSDGETEIGAELTFSLLHCENMYGDLGKAKSTYWLQVWGVSEQILEGRVAFCTYVKGRSLNLLSTSILEAVLNETNVGELLLKSTFQKQQNEYGVHYIVKFEQLPIEKTDPNIKKIQSLMVKKPIFLDTNIPETLFRTEDMTPDESMEKLERIRATIKANKN